jgi:hypothetical protein
VPIPLYFWGHLEAGEVSGIQVLEVWVNLRMFSCMLVVIVYGALRSGDMVEL